MLKKIRFAVLLARQMGLRYVFFRAKYELLRRSGLLEKQFPVNPKIANFVSLDNWRAAKTPFFFQSKNELNFPKKQNLETLEKSVAEIHDGVFPFFNSLKMDVRPTTDWLKNPDSGRHFPLVHWTKIADFSPEFGDIKYVWERARFSWIYHLIRFDFYSGIDQSAFIFNEMESFIEKNPINEGPNWRCSQEISLRVLNWTFALHFYKNSAELTEARFQKIIHSIYWSLRHVRSNIDFSRIAVRNNHALTETATLFLGGLLFPFFSESAAWRRDGKRWFEQEIAYQIYEDGTFLQFSMNYHRVAVQILTWVLSLAARFEEQLSPVVAERATASLRFLRACMDEKTGWLPNYGQNDGALFFPLNDCDYRDFRPQMQALASVLGLDLGFGKGDFDEDSNWFGFLRSDRKPSFFIEKQTFSFKKSGYFILHEPDGLTFLRCGNHRDRPSQADNLHLDIWLDGKNWLRDAGTFKYNLAWSEARDFQGTAAHNTVALGDFDQMEKGPRFVWLGWSQAVEATGWLEKDDFFEFQGKIEAFGHVAKGIFHKRTVRKWKSARRWEIVDELAHPTDLPMRQFWHFDPTVVSNVKIWATDESNSELSKNDVNGWFSSYYGKRETNPVFFFETQTHQIRTLIEA